jgi:DNA-binding transcriptional LysR family regulator
MHMLKPSQPINTLNGFRRMDRIGDLNLFLRVLDSGSISAAARSLDVSVAVASQRLKRLEKSLGVRLLHRTTRTLKVTTEGAALAARGRPLIEDLESLTGSLRETAEQSAGTLRVTIPASFGRQYISPLLPEFLQRYPRVNVHVHLADQMLDLVSEGFDLAIRIGTLPDSSLVARRLASNQRVLCASPEYLRRMGTPATPGDLERHECLILSSMKQTQDHWHLSPRAGGDEVAVRIRGRLESNFGEVIRDAALSGLGIALHSTWHVCDDIVAGRLKVLLPDYQLRESAIYAVMPERRLVLPRVRAFVEFLSEHFDPVPPWDRHLRKRKTVR